NRSSRARKTTPTPPRPISRSIRYRPLSLPPGPGPGGCEDGWSPGIPALSLLWSPDMNSSRAGSIIEPRLSITSLSLSSTMTQRATRVQSGFNCGATVIDLSGKYNCAGLLIDYRDSGRFRTGVNFQPEVGNLRILDLLLENDCEREATKHGC